MKQTQEQIEHLRTIRETSSFWADVAENQLPALADKIDNIKLPEIDTTELAKQGENTEATNTAILAEIKAINDLKNIYSARFEKNDDGDNTYTMVLPLVAGIVGDTIIM